MTADEIFSKIGAHFVEGMMFHDDMTKYYNFLGLCGYSKCHEYHFIHETKGYIKLCNYYMEHYHKLIGKDKVDSTSHIPQNWYKYAKQEVDSSTKRNAVRDGVEMWIKWETETKELLSEAYKDLMSLNEVASAMFLIDYVNDVTRELTYAKNKLLYLNDINFTISQIVSEQKELKEKYAGLL